MYSSPGACIQVGGVCALATSGSDFVIIPIVFGVISCAIGGLLLWRKRMLSQLDAPQTRA